MTEPLQVQQMPDRMPEVGDIVWLSFKTEEIGSPVLTLPTMVTAHDGGGGIAGIATCPPGMAVIGPRGVPQPMIHLPVMAPYSIHGEPGSWRHKGQAKVVRPTGLALVE